MLWGKFNVEKTPVLIVNEEDNLRRLKERFEVMQIADRELPIYFRVATGAKLHKLYVEGIIKECKEKDIRVVMFDSLRSIHEASENDSTEMQKVMEFLKCIAREDITVVFTHHHKKKQMFQARGGADQESSRGSSGINAAVNGHISLEEKTGDDGNTYIVVNHLKAKDCEKILPFELKVVKENKHIDFIYCGEQKTNDTQKEVAKNKIIIALQNEKRWVGTREIFGWKFASEKPTRGALRELDHEGMVNLRTRSQLEKSGIIDKREGSNPREVFYKVDEIKAKEVEEAEETFDGF
jgi:hypothetical protein